MTKRKKIFFSIAVFFLLIIVFRITILIFSRVNDIRAANLMFYNNVEPLFIYTKTFKPNVKDIVKISWAGEINPDPRGWFGYVKHLKFFTDADGYLSVSDKLAQGKEYPKIIFCGGSTTECLAVNELFRFPYLTGIILKEKFGLNFKTLNAGIRGHTTQDTINLIFYRHRYIKPEYLIIMHNINDRSWLKNNLSYQWHCEHTEIFSRLKQLSYNLMYRSNLCYMIAGVLQKYKILRILPPFHNLPSRKQGEILDRKRKLYNPEELFLNFSRQFELNLLCLISICRIHAIEPILMTQPLCIDDKEQDKFNEIIRNVCKRTNVVLIDLATFMPMNNRSKYFFNDKIHLNDEGSIFVSKIIAKELAAIINNGNSNNHEQKLLSLPH